MNSTHQPESASADFHLTIGLRDTGWHPGSWFRIPAAQEVFTPQYWGSLAQTAEASGADLVTFDDSLGLQRQGQLDASLVAAWVGARTSRIGLVPTLTTTHTEPFHLSKNIATLDYISSGRAGWLAEVSATAEESALFGRGRDDLDAESLYAEASDVVDVVRRLWDSWEDEAEIRDSATGRFVDREKLHYIDYEGDRFTVKGPSITPRPPQGQPVVALQGSGSAQLKAAAQQADVLFLSAAGFEEATGLLEKVRTVEAEIGRSGAPLLVFVDLQVLIEPTAEEAQARLTELDEAAGEKNPVGQQQVIGTSAEVAERIQQLAQAGFSGVRLLPAEHRTDLARIAEELSPQLTEAGVVVGSEQPLRFRLGLETAPNRYADAENQPALAGGAA